MGLKIVIGVSARNIDQRQLQYSMQQVEAITTTTQLAWPNRYKVTDCFNLKTETSHLRNMNALLQSKKRGASNALVSPKTKASKSVAVTASTMNPGVLNMALIWLDPVNLTRSSRVCKEWRDGIADYSWKQAAKNVNEEAYEAIQQALRPNKKSKLDSKALALGLAKNKKEITISIPKFPHPTLKPEDIFLLLEIEVFGTKRAFCQSLSKCVEELDQRETLQSFSTIY
jgi:hypothetical protein